MLSGAGPEGEYTSVSVVDAVMTAGLEGTGVDPALAVAAVPNAATAYLALNGVAHLRPGEQVLVNGALGGLASAFPGIRKRVGFRGGLSPCVRAPGSAFQVVVGVGKMHQNPWPVRVDQRLDRVALWTNPPSCTWENRLTTLSGVSPPVRSSSLISAQIWQVDVRF
jgi:hypothetical protein